MKQKPTVLCRQVKACLRILMLGLALVGFLPACATLDSSKSASAGVVTSSTLHSRQVSKTSEVSNPATASHVVVAETVELPWTEWTDMRHNSFPLDILLALKSSDDGQCARLVSEKLITVAECDEALMKAQSGQCLKGVTVPNGTKLAGVTGLKYHKGKLVPAVFLNRIVALPHDPIATQCTLNNGKILYFFNGEPSISCYNFGIKYQEPIIEKPVPVKETSEHCRFIPTGVQMQEGGIDIVPGYVNRDACGDVTGSAATAVWGSRVTTTQVSGGRIVCDDY